MRSILPMWGIHGAMTAAKHSELERLTATLQTAARTRQRPSSCCCRCTGRQIADTSEWPASAGVCVALVVLRRDPAVCVGRGRARAGSGVERVGFALTLLQSDAALKRTSSITEELSDETARPGYGHRRRRPDRLRTDCSASRRARCSAPISRSFCRLLEITPALGALDGVIMEVEDCAFPLVHGMIPTDDPNVAFKDADYALLVGSRPRSKGMERKDLIEANAAIFSVQGKALNQHASRTGEGARGRQPGEHELSDRAAQRAGSEPAPVHRDDAARPQPRRCATREKNRQTHDRSQTRDDLGQPFGDAISRRARGDHRPARTR